MIEITDRQLLNITEFILEDLIDLGEELKKVPNWRRSLIERLCGIGVYKSAHKLSVDLGRLHMYTYNGDNK